MAHIAVAARRHDKTKRLLVGRDPAFFQQLAGHLPEATRTRLVTKDYSGVTLPIALMTLVDCIGHQYEYVRRPDNDLAHCASLSVAIGSVTKHGRTMWREGGVKGQLDAAALADLMRLFVQGHGAPHIHVCGAPLDAMDQRAAIIAGVNGVLNLANNAGPAGLQLWVQLGDAFAAAHRECYAQVRSCTFAQTWTRLMLRRVPHACTQSGEKFRFKRLTCVQRASSTFTSTCCLLRSRQRSTHC